MRRVAKRIIGALRARLTRRVPVYIPVLTNSLLDRRVALVTGATSGIGQAIAGAFLRSGATVVVTGRNARRLQQTCDSFRRSFPDGDQRVVGAVLDIASPSTFPTVLESIHAQLDGRRIDILVNNAGVLGSFSFGKITEQQFDDVLDTNLRGTYLLSQAVADQMVRNRLSGNILNIASSSSLRPAISPYTLSKWALRGLTLGLAKTLIQHDIVVNGLAPGPTATPMLIAGEVEALELPSSPSGRYATAEEIAEIAVILVSRLSRMIVGDTIYMTGGAGLLTIDDIEYRFHRCQ